MSEEEYIDWELLFSPRKKKKKKVKTNSLKVLTQIPKDSTNKKKKKNNAKFKKAMNEKKAKRKEKKRKKKEKLSKVQESLVNSCVDETDCAAHLTSGKTNQDSKNKRKKRVAFDLPHNYKRVKRPKLPSSPQQAADCLSPISAVEEVTAVIGPSQIQAKNNDSQSTSDEMQSQDLFITQKTFQVPLSEVSSEETSDRAEDNTNVKEVSFRETQSQSVFYKTQKITKSSDLCQKKRKSSSSNHFLEEPIVVTSSPDREKIKNSSVMNRLSHSGRQQKSLTSVYTQTENFFTTELSLYLNFCRKNKSNALSNEPAPLDLSLPHSARRDPRTSAKEKYENDDFMDVFGEGSVQLSSCGKVKEERSLSPQSETDIKSADTTVSSEEAEMPSRTTRLELMQVRAVQMRLNESFFFKTKGEPSPRPDSPLMKLVQGRGVKSHRRK